jgi:hypothetical protein
MTPANNLLPYYQQVEKCLETLGILPEKARRENLGEWTITKGSATIHIYVQYLEKNQDYYFWVISPVCNVPDEQYLRKFYEELLETNHTLYGVAFTKYEDWVYIKCIRELKGIDLEEMFNIITRVANYTDMYDDVFFAKYGTNMP